MNPHEELFHRLLDESSSMLAAPESASIAIPDDELHREIIVPLLPAMLADAAIRGHWSEQTATGFVARIGRHFENAQSAPRWLPADFEIHVTASYSAGADARALADTLLSEESLRDMTTTLMNQLLDALWPSLAPAPRALPSEISEIEIETSEITSRAAEEISAIPDVFTPLETTSEPEPEFTLAPPVETAPEILPPAIPPSAIEPERAEEVQPAEFLATQQASSRALIRTLCRKLSAPAMQRGLASHGAGAWSAAILARRILRLTEVAAKPSRPTSPRRLPRRASL